MYSKFAYTTDKTFLLEANYKPLAHKNSTQHMNVCVVVLEICPSFSKLKRIRVEKVSFDDYPSIKGELLCS
jgi:hypothetical protein